MRDDLLFSKFLITFEIIPEEIKKGLEEVLTLRAKCL